jgi:hypothetical protein
MCAVTGSRNRLIIKIGKSVASPIEVIATSRAITDWMYLQLCLGIAASISVEDTWASTNYWRIRHAYLDKNVTILPPRLVDLPFLKRSAAG